jgi:sigma-B regulation protein RsbU (phosphoserine phosphatase)
MDQDIVTLLKKVSLFANMPETMIVKIADGAEIYPLAKNEVLIRKGDPATSLFIILSGWVKIVTVGPENKELVFNQAGPGHIVGETSLIDRTPYSTTVIALSSLQVIKLKYDIFQAVLEQYPPLALAFIGKTFDRLRFADLYIEKTIEWSHYIAGGNYSVVQDQIRNAHTSIVETGQTPEIRIGAFLSALFHMVKDIKQREEALQQVILPLGMALSAERDPDQLLERVLVETKSICNADAATLYLLDENNQLNFAIMRNDSLNIALGGASGQTIPFAPLPLYDKITGEPNYQNVATCVALRGHSINIPDIYHNTEFDLSGTKSFDLENNYRTISSLTVPLKDHANKVIGVLQLLNTQDPTSKQVIPFDSYHQLVVESLTSQTAVALNNQMLLKRQEVLAKFERDVHIGRQIQLDFLPKPVQLPQPPGWEIVTYFQAAREVAGDFFDAFPIQNKIGLVVADVCDKGVGAALFMSLSRSLLRAFAEQHRPLGWLDEFGGDQSAAMKIDVKRRRKLLSAGTSALLAMELTNNYIAHNHGDMNMFATVFFGVLDPATGILTYTNGGHPPPAIISARGEVKTRLPATGPAVGMMPDVDFDIQQVKLEPGDTLFAFSDGVTDARAPDKKFFTEKQLLPLLAQPVSSATDLLERVKTSLQAHIASADQFDDITILAARRMSTL